MVASKKVHHDFQIHILSCFLSLSLSLDTGTEKGDILKGILPREGNGPPSPPTDPGFEGWSLGRVRQPAQSTQAPHPPTDQGFEG
jgi:hypothetical protein